MENCFSFGLITTCTSTLSRTPSLLINASLNEDVTSGVVCWQGKELSNARLTITKIKHFEVIIYLKIIKIPVLKFSGI